MNMIQIKIGRLKNAYDPDRNLFDNQSIQMNYIDAELLDIIQRQQDAIETLAARLAKLEVFTGMVAPEPLPDPTGE